MATAATLSKNENGKRERNQMEAEDSEFIPLSKRINNLHLNQNGGASIQHSHPHFELPQGLNGDSHGNYDKHNAMNGLNYNELQKPHSCVNVTNGHHDELGNISHSYEYSPSLDSSANPHYYEPNRQLYLLYLERMQRTGQILHPQFFHTE